MPAARGKQAHGKGFFKGKKSAPQKLGSILDEVLSERGYKSICKEYSIVAKWSLIAGEKLSAVSSCERIDNGILFVKVSSAPWRHEASYAKPELLKKIREEFDCPTIRDIVFH
ncbi:MAG: DUF721 domain-containing protein [Chitinispirillaceae bacterium]|nr:DUF721 domain-containing protein [Chitinispirillaceae bacterium]